MTFFDFNFLLLFWRHPTAFPGLSDELLAAGAVPEDVLADSLWYFEGGSPRCASGLEGLLLSRPLLEGIIRERVRKIRNLTMIENCAAESLAVSDNKLRVIGVRASNETIPTDLVVDASGRASHSPAWLEANGYPKPEDERVQIAMGYTTRLFRRSLEDINGDGAVVIPPTRDGKRGGVMLGQEGLRMDRHAVRLFRKLCRIVKKLKRVCSFPQAHLE